ncbi:degenerin del-1-like [Hermetia illucens]|uniref:degenerin del-1-like n=1 Tax=Hermetia illucens TaxID=343691 RepID=UPI0018CC0F79|nr:degenerin del-1-like [Hermetia illucens]
MTSLIILLVSHTGNYKPCISTDVRGWFEKTAFFRVFFTIRDDYFRPDIAIREEQCACMPECDRLEYGEEFSPLDLVNDNSMEGGLVVDIYYQHGTMIKYRTEAVYEWLDLLVAFGGIGGLLMGASILSGVELIYYFTIGVFVYLRDQVGRMKTSEVKLLSGRSP